MMNSENDKIKVSSMWERYNRERTEELNWYNKYSKATNSAVFPDWLTDGTSLRIGQNMGKPSNQNLQSFGARGLSVLCSKIALTLFPPASRFFGMTYDKNAVGTMLADMDDAEQTTVISQIMSALIHAETAINNRIMASNVQEKIDEVLRRLAVTGNHLLIADPANDDLEWHGIENFVVKRDAQGKIVHLIIRVWVHEEEAKVLLDKGTIRKTELPTSKTSVQDGGTNKARPVYSYYTAIERARTPGGSLVYLKSSWLDDLELPMFNKQYTKDTLPYHVLGWTKVAGMDYRQPYIAELYGDLVRLEKAMRNRSNAGFAISRIIYMIRSRSRISPLDFRNARSGDTFSGEDGDVSPMNMPKIDIQQLSVEIEDLRQDLGAAFLMLTPRRAERVTAEEIRIQTTELQQSRANVYHSLANELQMTLIKWAAAKVEINLEALKEDFNLYPALVGGYGGLGSEITLNNIARAYSVLNSCVPNEAGQVTNTIKLANEIMQSSGIAPNDFLMTANEIAEQMVAAQQMQQNQQMNMLAMQQQVQQQ